MFFALSADLNETLNTDAIDLVDLHTVQPAVASAIFRAGILLIGDQKRAATLQQQLTTDESEQSSPRERIEAALDSIDDHLDDGESGVPATGKLQTDE